MPLHIPRSITSLGIRRLRTKEPEGIQEHTTPIKSPQAESGDTTQPGNTQEQGIEAEESPLERQGRQ